MTYLIKLRKTFPKQGKRNRETDHAIEKYVSKSDGITIELRKIQFGKTDFVVFTVLSFDSGWHRGTTKSLKCQSTWKKWNETKCKRI